MRFVVRSHISHLDPINDNIIILIKKLREVFGVSRVTSGSWPKSVSACSKTCKKGYEIIVDLPGAQTKMKAKYIEGRIGFEVVKNKRSSWLEKMPGFLPFWSRLIPLFWYLSILNFLVSRREIRYEPIKFISAHTNNGFYRPIGREVFEIFINHALKYPLES